MLQHDAVYAVVTQRPQPALSTQVAIELQPVEESSLRDGDLAEDTRNRDVLYIGTETGIFVSLDRGGSWRRLRGNLPTVRVDELTIHPRDNALLVATHGRALWILDHLEPIQEYTAVKEADATLITPGFTLQWKYKDDRNDEFWGHQFFTGENPPSEAVIPMYLRAPLTNGKLRIADAGCGTVPGAAHPRRHRWRRSDRAGHRQ